MVGRSDQDIIFWQYALNASWVLLPLVPAILIYLIFPKTQTRVQGPLSGLSIRASGAFAAYFIVLIATTPLLIRQNNNLESLLHPTWTITGSIQLEDEDGHRLAFNNRGESPFKIDLDPQLVEATGTDGFKIRVPEREDNSVPTLLITYPDFASHTLDPNHPDPGENVKIDADNKLVDVTSPIILRKKECIGLSCDQGS